MIRGILHAARVCAALCRARTVPLSPVVWAIALAVLLWGGIVPRATAQTDNPAFNEWWGRVTSGASSSPVPNGIMLRCLVFEEYYPADDELEAMRKSIEGKPDHPLRRRLQYYEYLRNAGPQVPSRRTVWKRGDEWRYNIDPCIEHPESYSDYVWAKSAVWQLSRKRLAIAEPEERSSRSMEVASLRSSVDLYAVMLLRSGMVVDPGMKLTVTLKPDGEWIAIARHPEDGTEVTAAGRWDPDRGLGLIERSTYRRRTSTPQPADDVTNIVKRWSDYTGAGLALAAEVQTISNRDQRPFRRYVLEEVREFTPTEFEELIRLPKPGDTDAVRGVVTYTTVVDDRPGTPSQSWADSGGLKLDARNPTVSSSEVPLRVVGWLVIAAIVVALSYLRWRKK